MVAAASISANPLKLDVRSHLKCLGICFIATIATFQYGLDYALVGGFMAMPGFLKVYGYYDATEQKYGIDPTVQQLISSLMTIGTFVGSLLVGPFSAKLGRKYGLWAASLLNAVATAIMLGTTSVGVLYFARLILGTVLSPVGCSSLTEPGISVGWFLTFSQVYIHEAAPAHLRGIVFAVYQCQLSTGSIVGAAVDYGTKSWLSKRAYQVPLAVFFAAPTIQSIAMLFFPESPRWLMTQGREDEAENALRRLRNKNIDQIEFQAELNEIRQSTRHQGEQNKKQLFIEMWRGTNLRRTLLSIAIICFHCANGSSWTNIYTTYFLTVAQVTNPFGYSIMMTCMGLIGVFFSAFVVRHLYRRTIIMVGVTACGLCQLSFAIAWSAAPGTQAAAKAVVAFLAIFTFSYVAYGKLSLFPGLIEC